MSDSSSDGRRDVFGSDDDDEEDSEGSSWAPSSLSEKESEDASARNFEEGRRCASASGEDERGCRFCHEVAVIVIVVDGVRNASSDAVEERKNRSSFRIMVWRISIKRR